MKKSKLIENQLIKTIGLIMLFHFCHLVNAQQSVGVFLNTPQAFNGYTLFGNNEITYLIDNCGYQINSWESDYDPGLAMYLLENGQLLRTAKVSGSFSAGGLGGRFELFDWNGNLLWEYIYANSTYHAHHDIAPLPNGNFLAIAWEKHSAAEAEQLGRIDAGELWSERIVEIEMIGTNQANIIWEWRLWDHLIQDTDPSKPNYGNISEHPELIDINYIDETEDNEKDWIHLNSIDYHPELDQIILSSRNFSEIWIIDHSTTTSQAAGHTGGNANKGGDILYRYGNPQAYQRGDENDRLFFKQHDAQWINAGTSNDDKLIVFNNLSLPNKSSVDIWQPPIEGYNYPIDGNTPFAPEEVEWNYTENGFYSAIMSGAQVLPSSNILICEGKEGRLFEITPTSEIVWEYINPVNRNGSPVSQGGTPLFNDLFRAQRYGSDYPAFIGKDMTPGVPVEINPWELDCEIFDDPVSTLEKQDETLIHIVNNPVIDHLHLYAANSDHTTFKGQIHNLLGEVMKSIEIKPGYNSYSSTHWPAGLYFLVVVDERNRKIVSLPFIR